MVGRVGFGGFVILWPKPNSTRYKFFFFITQPNPPSLKNRPNPVGRVGLGRVWRVGGFSTHPYPPVVWLKFKLLTYGLKFDTLSV